MSIKDIITDDWTMQEVEMILNCADAELELRSSDSERFEELRQIIGWCNGVLDALSVWS